MCSFSSHHFHQDDCSVKPPCTVGWIIICHPWNRSPQLRTLRIFSLTDGDNKNKRGLRESKCEYESRAWDTAGMHNVDLASREAPSSVPRRPPPHPNQETGRNTHRRKWISSQLHCSISMYKQMKTEHHRTNCTHMQHTNCFPQTNFVYSTQVTRLPALLPPL